MYNPFDKRVRPLDNGVFLKVFGTEDAKPHTLTLINLILGKAGIEPLERIDEIRADATLPGVVGAYAPRTDVLVVDGMRVVDLEAHNYTVDFANMMLAYAANLLAARIPKGDPRKHRFRRLPQVVVIMLLDGVELMDADGPFTVGRLHWEHGEGCAPATDRLALVVCNLERVKRMYTEDRESVAADECFSWLHLLSEGFDDEEEVGSLMEYFPTIEEFAAHYDASVGEGKIYRDYEDAIAAAEDSNRRVTWFADSIKEKFPDIDAATLEALRQECLVDV